ncbi:glycoside hydrolase family 3 protein [Paenibacillus cymbidii]|uniref:glycoside hydrolase family 3 protein n=1 Tax=Paenibacillus cymbidii TaxID=1639034 RepID=UPI0010807CAF|nr:glycoside hydrolase family 3 N-terminal domain-containing protein [Paenibacillus cymbidii]
MIHKVPDLREMTLEQKVGQMVIVRAHGFEEAIRRRLSTGEIGAVGHILLHKTHDKKLERLIAVINEYRKLAGCPILFYCDGEAGLGAVFDFGTRFPSMMALGATRSAELAYRMGHAIGREVRAAGFHMISNPTVDINTNPNNPIINIRSIGEDPALVESLAAAYVAGMQEAGIIPLAKHYPGHGDTSQDSHVEMPALPHYSDRLYDIELKPYRTLIARGLTGVMTAHLYVPALQEEDEPLPATLSRSVITGILRQKLGFEGLIVSDSLTMRGIKSVYGIEEAAVMAIQAGHDLILQDYQSDPEITLRAVCHAVRSGRVDVERIDEAVSRIFQYKARFNIMDNKEIDIRQSREVLDCEEHRTTARDIAAQSVTKLTGRHLPLRADNLLLIAVIGDEEGTEVEDMSFVIESRAGQVYERVRRFSPDAELLLVHEKPTEEDRRKVERAIQSERYDAVVFATFIRVVSYKPGSAAIPKEQADLADWLVGAIDKTVILLFGSPYVLHSVRRPANCLCAYSDDSYSIVACVDAVFGQMPTTGKLPITIGSSFPYGYGLS